MASNIERLGGYIKDKTLGTARDFAFGAKAAFYSGNPVVFSNIESGINKLKDSFRKNQEEESKSSRREQAEQRRQRGFQEEQAREQRYNELQQQKIFESMDENIKSILKILSKRGGDKDKDSIDVIADALKLASTASLINAANKLKTASEAIAKSLPNTVPKTIPRYLQSDLLDKNGRPLRGAARTSRMGRLDRMRTSVTPETPRRVPMLPDADFTKTRGVSFLDDIAARMSAMVDAIRASVSNVYNSIKNSFLTGVKNIGTYITELAKDSKFVASVLKVGGFLGKLISYLFKPITAVIFTVVDGLFQAFNTEAIMKATDKSKEDIGFSERMAGFFGGAVGGILDFVKVVLGSVVAFFMGKDYEDIYGTGRLEDRTITNELTKVFDWFFDLASNSIVSFVASITGNDYVKKEADKNLEYLRAKATIPLFQFMQEAGWVIEDYINGAKNIFYDIAEQFSLALVTFEGVKKEIGFAIEDGAKYVINNIAEAMEGAINFVINGINKLVISIIDRLPDTVGIPNTDLKIDLTDEKAFLKKKLTIGNVSIGRVEAKTSQAERDLSYNFDAERRKEISAKYDELRVGPVDRTQMRLDMYNRDANYLETLRTRSQVGTGTPVSPAPAALAEASGNLDPNIPPDDKLSTRGDTEEQTEEIVQALEGSSEACLEGDEKLIDSGKVLSEAEQAAADSRHEESMAMAQANYRLQEAFNAQINGWMSQQSDLVQALLDPLLKGGSGGGPLGTIFKNIFGESGIGDALGNLLGKGKGGLFDSISGFFKSNLGGLSTLGDALGDLLKGSSGTNIFSTPGFGGGTAGMDPLAALLGTKLSGSLGLTGVGANAAFDVAKSLLSPGTGMAGIKGALQGPGGFAGGLGAIMSVFNGNVDTPGGALSAGLGVYQLLRGGGVGGVLGGGISALGNRLVAAQMASSPALTAMASQGYGNAALAEAAKTGVMGNIGGTMASFGAGMSAGASTGFNLGGQGFMGMGQTGFAANAGAALGAIGNGMMTYAIANMLSGGYEINKSLNKVAGAVGAFFGPVGAAITGVVMGGLNRLFGRKAKEYTDVGLDLNLGTDTTGQVYKDWIKKGGVYRSDKKGTEYEDLDNDLVQYFNSSAKAIQQGYGSLAEMMGLSADSIVGFAQSYSISLKGLSAAEQQKKIAEAMEQYARDAIRSSYGDVSRFSKQGEDTLQTFERMATAAQSVNYWFDALGYTAEQTVDMFSKMVDAQGLLTASSTGFFNVDWMNSPYYQQMMEEFGGGDYAGGGRGAYSQYFTDGMANMFGGGIPIAYLQNMYGAGQQGTFEPTEEQKKLAIAGAQANFVEMFGGQEQFGRVMQSYFTGFYTPEEQAEFMARQATIQAQQQLELVQTQLDALSEQFEGIDPDLAQRLEGITSREQIEEAKAEYRKAIEAAMESGDMALAAELLQSADIFTQAAEMQLQAAEMNGEAASSAQDYAIGQIESGYSGVYVSTNQASGNLGTSAALIQDDMSSEPSAQVNAITPIVMGGNTVNNSSAQISSMGGGSGSSVRDYHPILSIDVRGTTAGYLGLGSR